MTGLTRALAQFASRPPFKHLPGDVLPVVRNGFIDTVAALLAGRSEPVVRVMRDHLGSRIAAAGESDVLAGVGRASRSDAALINGTAAHALDYDDVALNGHPSTVLVPTLLAEGEALGASGAAVLKAYLVGYETWAALIRRDADPHHLKGWHPTAIFGTLAAAAAVANLRGVSEEVACHALGIAASMAGGLTANFGSMTKPLHAGRAACAGIEAVRLAECGLTASPDAVEHRAGFLQAVSPKGQVDLSSPLDGLGATLRIRDSGLNIKKYPVCYAVHRVIDGMLDLVTRNDLRPQQVRAIHVRLGATQAAMLRNHAPQTALEAKFSLEFAMASALTARAVGLAELRDEFVQRQDVQTAMRQVQMQTVDSVCPIEPFLALTDRVTVQTDDGRELDTGELRFARGSAKLPLTASDIQRKFRDCAAVAAQPHTDQLFANLMALNDLRDVRSLLAVHH